MPRRSLRRGLTKRDIRVSGIEELQQQLNNLAREISGKQVIDEVLLPAAITARDEIKSTAREIFQTTRTHPAGWFKIIEATLAARGDPSRYRRGPSVLFGINAKKAPQAFWQEFGTSRMPPNPFYRPAKAAVRPTLAHMIATGLQRVIDKVVK